VGWPKIEPGNSGIRNRSANSSTATFSPLEVRWTLLNFAIVRDGLADGRILGAE
jgi:hypothetical protein